MKKYVVTTSWAHEPIIIEGFYEKYDNVNPRNFARFMDGNHTVIAEIWGVTSVRLEK